MNGSLHLASSQIADDLTIAAPPEHLYLGFGDRPKAVTRREIVESFHEPARAVSESSVEVKNDQPVGHAFPSPSRNSANSWQQSDFAFAGPIGIDLRRLRLAEKVQRPKPPSMLGRPPPHPLM